MKQIIISIFVFFSVAVSASNNPTANIAINPASGYLPMTLNLSATGSTTPTGTIVSYSWNFGDGTTGEGAEVSHYYSSKKTENIRLTVTNSAGKKDTAHVVFRFKDDQTPPNLSFDVPNEFTVQTDTPIITAFYSDANSKVDLTRVKLILDDEEVTDRAVISDSHVVLQFTSQWPLIPGKHKLSVKVYDYYGNSVSKFVKFSYKPEIITTSFLNGRVLGINGLPLSGVEVLSVSGPTGIILSGMTNNDGEYSIPFTVGGEYMLRFGKLSYLETQKTKALIAGQDDTLDAVYLAKGDSKKTLITAASGGTATNSNNTISLIIPPGAMATNSEISITEAKTGKTLAVPLPNGSQFTFAQTLQPLGLTFNEPVVMTLNNVLGFPPGFEIPVGLSNLAGIWTDSGYKGRVSDDGTKVVFLFTNSAPGFNNSVFNREEMGPSDTNANTTNPEEDEDDDWDWEDDDDPLPPDTETDEEENPEEPCEGGSRISVRSCDLGIDYNLPQVTRRGKKFGLTLSYSSLTANPKPILSVSSRDLRNAQAPTNVVKKTSWMGNSEEKIFAGTSAVKPSAFFSTFDPKNIEGKSYPSGSYPYRVEMASRYDTMVYAETPYFGGPALAPTTVQTREPVYLQDAVYGRVSVNNQKNSPFGSGWSLSGMERLVQNVDGAISLFDGAGKSRTYLPLGPSKGAVVTQKLLDGAVENLHYHKGQIFGADCSSNQVFRLDGKGRFTTLAGGPQDKITELNCPMNIYPSRKGGYYVSDSGNGRIVYVGADRALKTVADKRMGLDSPTYVAEDNVLAVHFIDGNEIKTISPFDGSIITFVGQSREAVYKYKLSQPTQIHFDEYHNLIVTDAGLGKVIKFFMIGKTARVVFDGIKGIKALSFDPILKRYFALDKAGSLHHWAGQGKKKTHALDLANGVPVMTNSFKRKSGIRISAIAYSPELGLITSSSSGIQMKAIDYSAKSKTQVHYVPSIADFSTLVKNQDGTFTRTLVDKTVIQYNTSGLIVSKASPGGDILAFEYGPSSRVLKVHVPGGGFYQFNYDGRGLLRSIIDPANRESNVVIDGNGDLVSISNPEAHSWTYTYSPEHMLLTKQDERGLITEYQYALSRIVEATYPGGRRKEVKNAAVDQLLNETTENEIPRIKSGDVVTQFISPEGKITNYILNGSGVHEAYIDGEGGKTSFRRNLDSLPVEVSSPEGRKTFSSYDELGRVSRSVDSRGQLDMTYDLVSQKLSSVKDAFNHTVSYQYDSQGNIEKIINQKGKETNFSYNSDGTLKSVADAYGNVTLLERDEAGNETATIDPLGNRTSLERDDAGNVTSSTDPLGFKTLFDFDSTSKMTKITDAKSGVTLFAYLTSGEIESITDARNAKTTFGYNDQGRVTSVLNHLNQEEVIVYDLDGKMVSKTTKKGDVFGFTYNNNNLMTQKTFPGDSVNFSYDRDKLLTSVSDSDSIVERRYDAFNRLASESSSHVPAEVSYMHDQRGETAGIKLTVQNRVIIDVRRIYNQTGRAISISGFVMGKKINIGRNLDDSDRLERVVYPNGTATVFQYDKNSRAVNQTTTNVSGLNHSLSYKYSANGNITLVQDELNGQRRFNRFKYDELSRLVEEDALDRRPYNLDPLGNNLLNGGQYNELNHLIENYLYEFEHDLNGNRTKKISKLTGAKWEYIFNPENKLQSVKIYRPGNILSKTLSYGYDGFHRRIFKSMQDHENAAKSYTRKYIFDGSNILAVLDENNTFVASYIHGEGFDDPLVMVADLHGNGEMSVLSLVKDRQQSVKMILGESGEVLQEVNYSAYGETQITNRAQFKNKIPNTCYFTSRELEEETGEYYYRARYYDPYSQRFLSEDPIGFKGGDTNLFRYLNNNPLKTSDPKGTLSTASVTACLLALAVGEVFDIYETYAEYFALQDSTDAKIQALDDELENTCITAKRKKEIEREKEQIMKDFQRQTLLIMAGIFSPGTGVMTAAAACVLMIGTF